MKEKRPGANSTGQTRLSVRDGGDSLLGLSALYLLVQTNKRNAKLIAWVLAATIKKAGHMRLTRRALGCDFVLRVSAINQFLDKFSPVHRPDYHLRDCLGQAPS